MSRRPRSSPYRPVLVPPTGRGSGHGGQLGGDGNPVAAEKPRPHLGRLGVGLVPALATLSGHPVISAALPPWPRPRNSLPSTDCPAQILTDFARENRFHPIPEMTCLLRLRELERQASQALSDQLDRLDESSRTGECLPKRWRRHPRRRSPGSAMSSPNS